jgi:sterol desaturase/sphingolipid hydroxylase (fatty acid hydroxylase superfamily)
MTMASAYFEQFVLTLWHVAPWLAGLGVGFALLSHFSPCNDGKPWWEKRGLFTDLCYWIFAPVFSRYLRVWVTAMFTMWLFGLTTGQQIADFYQHGHGVLGALPLWGQAVFYLVATDFALYWIHRVFHDGFLWKYHAVHHASKDLEWISAARFHPLNLILGTAAVDIAAFLAGISPEIFLFVGPFTIITSCMVHANLNWTFGPLRGVFVSPVFHRWHHAMDVRDKNFASTFAIWDVMFGTYHMPVGIRPRGYGIDDAAMPEGIVGQMLYPLIQRDAQPETAAEQPA